MFPQELRSNRERTLRGFAIGIAIFSWLLVVVSIIGAIYGAIIALVILVAHALYLAHVRGNAVRLGPNQLPHLWNKVVAASQRLGLREPPAAYLMQSGGILNAFATKLLGRRFVILHSELVDACDGGSAVLGPSEIDFVIGHEVAHLAAGHLNWWLTPIRIIPLLGPAYSRACEYTCDRAGHSFVGDLEISSRALAILACGRRAGRVMNLDAFVEQRHETGGFWMAVYELNSTHPYLPKRIAALREMALPGTMPHVGRGFFAYPLAPMFGFASGGGASTMILVFAIWAAFAAKGLEDYMKKAKGQAFANQLSAGAQQIRAAEQQTEATAPATAAAPDDSEEPGVVKGERFDWKLQLPSDKWSVVPSKTTHAQNKLADRWITRADADAHVLVIGESLGGQAMTVDQLAQLVVRNAKSSAKKFHLVRMTSLGAGRVIEARGNVNGMELVQMYGVFVAGGNAYQVYAFAPANVAAPVKAEMLEAISSFQSPTK
jgi:Zn-dependent protease with chaperone function